MKALSHIRVAFLITFVLALSLAAAGCAPDPSAGVLSPELGEKLIAEAAGSEVEVKPTPEPLRIANLSDEEIKAGLPEEIAAAMAASDVANGEALTLANGCIGCHALDPDQQMTGPTWYNVGDTAANRVAGGSPALYLYSSIANPNAFVLDGYPANVMPQNYSETLSVQDLADLVSYLLAQHE